MSELSVPGDRSADFVAAIGFEPAFSALLRHDRTHAFDTPRGERIFRKIDGGDVTGRIVGTVYPHGGAEFSQRRPDGVTDINGHLLLRDHDGEWIYLYHKGFRRPDGYYRVTSWVDADVRGKHAWVAGLFFLGVGRPGEQDGTMRIDYFEVT